MINASDSIGTSADETTAQLSQRWNNLRQERPQVRIRDAAKALGVSEARLLSTRLGQGVTRLNVSQWAEFYKEMTTLGPVMTLTRNEYCVHEKTGAFENYEPIAGGRMGLATGIIQDLRLFFGSWTHAFAVEDQSPRGTLRSIQFFDASGTAIHKVYLKNETHIERFNEIGKTYAHPSQNPDELTFTAPVPPKQPTLADADVDVESFRKAWAGLQDTHDFFPLLGKYKLHRLQALRLGGNEFAREIPLGKLEESFRSAQASNLPIMVFVGNDGCIQIHSGPVSRLEVFDDWFNVLDPDFNLHLRQSGIASLWWVRKPSRDGDIHSLEAFDAQGEMVVQLFGTRKPGQPEKVEWTNLLKTLSSQS